MNRSPLCINHDEKERNVLGGPGRSKLILACCLLALACVGRVEADTGCIATIAGVVEIENGGLARTTRLRSPYSVIPHSAGGFVVADSGNHAIRRVFANDTVGTLAGIYGILGYSGDGGMGKLAKLNSPRGLATDGADGVFFADVGNHVVRRLFANGTIITVAGMGNIFGYSGDGGAATFAKLYYPSAVNTDGGGGIFIADSGNHVVRRVFANKTIVTVAGRGTVAGYFGDGGMAVAARLNYTLSIVSDGANGLLIADTGNHAIRRMFANGTIVTVAGGSGIAGYSGDGGAATLAKLYSPSTVTSDRAGGMLVADWNNHVIRRIFVNGTIATVAGVGGIAGYSGDGGPATAAKLDSPFGIIPGTGGSFYIADSSNHVIRFVAPNGTITSKVGAFGQAYTDGLPLAMDTPLASPYSLASDSNGLLIADRDNHVIRRVLGNGSILTVAGTGVAGSSGDGGPATMATLSLPQGIVSDDAGGVFIADTGKHVVRRVFANGSIVTVAGRSGTPGFSGDGGPATAALLYGPRGVGTDGKGGILIADRDNHVIRRVFVNGTISTLAGIAGVSGYFGDGGPATLAKLDNPRAMVMDGATMLIADAYNHVIRRVLQNGTIVTVAGKGSQGFSGDGGPATAAKLYTPTGVILDGMGGYIVPEAGNNVVRHVFSNGTIITLAGIGGLVGYGGEGGPASGAIFNLLSSVIRAADGGLIVADTNNNVIRRIYPDAACSSITSNILSCAATPASTLRCSITMAPAVPFVMWVNGSQCAAVVAPTNRLFSTAVAECALVSAPTQSPSFAAQRNAALVNVSLQWATQLGQYVQAVSVTVTPNITAVLVEAPPPPLFNTLHGSAYIVTIRSNMSLISMRSFVFHSRERPQLAYPCVNGSLAMLDSTTYNLTCALAMWSDMWWSNAAVLEGELLLADLILPFSISVSVAAAIDLPLPPQLSYVRAPVLRLAATAGIWVGVQPGVAAALTSLTTSAPAGCVCNGTKSTARGWVGAVPTGSCSWVNTSALLCIGPSNVTGSATIHARLIVEICCMLNLTSDGMPPLSNIGLAAASHLVLWDPSSLLAGSVDTGQTVAATPNAVINFTIPVPPTVLAPLALETSRVWVDDWPCQSITWDPIESILLCNDAPWSLRDYGGASAAGFVQLPIALELRGERLLTNSLLTVRLTPRILDVVPRLVSAGSCMGIFGTWLAGDDATSVRVVVGDDLHECGDAAFVTQYALRCCLPPNPIPASIVGYPLLRVTLLNNRGLSSENLTVTIPGEVSAQLIDDGTTRLAVPLNDQGHGAGQGFAIVPPVGLRTSGSEKAACSLGLLLESCPRSTVGARLVGNTSVTVELPLDTSYAQTTFGVVMAAVSLGCRFNLSATCTDGLGRVAVSSRTSPVVVGDILLSWQPSVATRYRTVPSASLPPVVATLAPGLVMLRAVGGNATLSSLLTCTAGVLPTITMAVDERLATSERTIVHTQCVVEEARQSMDGDMDVSCAGLRLPPSLLLGSEYWIHLQCGFSPTNEILSVEPLSVAIAFPELNIAYASLAGLKDAANQTTVTVTPYTPFALSVNLSLLNDTQCHSEGVQCIGVAMTNSSSAVCRLTLAQASSNFLVLSSGAPYRLGNNITTAVLEGPQSAQGALRMECTIWSQVIRSNLLQFVTAQFTIVPLGELPAEYIPSDAGARWLVRAPVRVAVQVDGGSFLRGASIQCTLAVSDSGLSANATVAPHIVTQDARTDPDLYAKVQADERGVIDFLPFGIRAGFDRDSVTMKITCVRPSGDGPVPYEWPMRVVPVTFKLCSGATLERATSTAFPVTATLRAACDDVQPTNTTIPLPAISCTLQSHTDAAVIQNGRIDADARTGQIHFPAVTVTAPPGQTYALGLFCFIASIPLPPEDGITILITLTGCPPGARVRNSFCQQCDAFQYSLGGNQMECTRCPPRGVTCNNGILDLQMSYYRPSRVWGRPIEGDSELYPCLNGEACAVNATARTHSCTAGYTGPLCAVCDATVGYARSGDVCRPCGDPSSQEAVLSLLILAIICALTFVALRKQRGQRSDASIVLKITMSYLQAVGSLRAFKAGGTKAYRDIMGWTDVVSASPFAFSQLECTVNVPFLEEYVTIICLPLLAAASVVAIFVIATAMRSIVICSPRLDGASLPRFEAERFKNVLRSWISQRRHISTLVFVLFLAYMSITSASLRVLDCYETPIDGTVYLRSDFRVECYVGRHAVARVLAFVTLLLLGLGFPALLFFRMTSATSTQRGDPHFRSAWGFLYDGYRDANLTPRPLHAEPQSTCNTRCMGIVPAFARLSGGHMMWWETLVLIRKAGVVLIAVLIRDPHFQSGAASLWLTFFLILQVRFQPYAARLFNQLETITLVAAVATTNLSFMLLRYDAADVGVDSRRPISMTTNEWVITIALVLINLGTFIVLAGLWLLLQSRRLQLASQGFTLRPNLILSRSHKRKELNGEPNPPVSSSRVEHPIVNLPVLNPLHRSTSASKMSGLTQDDTLGRATQHRQSFAPINASAGDLVDSGTPDHKALAAKNQSKRDGRDSMAIYKARQAQGTSRFKVSALALHN